MALTQEAQQTAILLRRCWASCVSPTYELIESLNDPADTDVEEAWDQEMTRRIAEIDSGQANLLSRDEFRKRIQARIGNR